MDDEIKLAGLEALVPEELEKHLILNSNRLRTFENARLEVVTYVEAKLGMRIRDPKPSDTGFLEHSDPMDVGTVKMSALSRQAKENGHQIRAMGVLSAVSTFSTRLHASKNNSKQTFHRSNQSKSWSTKESSISGKGKSKENHGNSKDCLKEQRVKTKDPKPPKAHAKEKHRKRASQVLKT